MLDKLVQMNSQVDYRTVFDISHKSFDWWFPLAGLGFVTVGTGLIWLSRRNRWSLSRGWVGYFMVVFATIWSLGVFVTTYSEYSHLQTAYRERNFSVIEGIVNNFQPMPYEGHREECFSVEIGAAMIGAIWTMVNIVELINRPRSQSV